jgi:hypothetical protein
MKKNIRENSEETEKIESPAIDLGSVSLNRYAQRLHEQKQEEKVPAHEAPEGTKFVKLDIIAGDVKSTSLKTFVAYMADKAGYLDEIYKKKVDLVNIEIDQLRKEYDFNLKMREKGSKKKLKIPPNRIIPERDFSEMFDEWLITEKVKYPMDILRMKIDDRWYRVKLTEKDSFSFDRLKDLPDAVIIFMEAEPSKFETQFVKNVDLKTAMIMHLFFGTQRIFFSFYFDYKDDKYKYECNQEEIKAKIENDLGGIFEYLEKEYEAPCSRISISPLTIKLRTDKPQHLSKTLHVDHARKLMSGKMQFRKMVDSHFK